MLSTAKIRMYFILASSQNRSNLSYSRFGLPRLSHLLAHTMHQACQNEPLPNEEHKTPIIMGINIDGPPVAHSRPLGNGGGFQAGLVVFNRGCFRGGLGHWSAQAHYFSLCSRLAWLFLICRLGPPP
jgi:hypothetical protein